MRNAPVLMVMKQHVQTMDTITPFADDADAVGGTSVALVQRGAHEPDSRQRTSRARGGDTSFGARGVTR